MDNDEVKLEVCANVEWLRNNCLGVIESDANDAARELSDRIFADLMDAGYEASSPRGPRTTYHGWNGCQVWYWHSGPVGTFDSLTDAQQKEIEDIIAKETESVRKDFADVLAD